MSRFSWPVRVYWEDTDGGGVVFYANYLRYLERARTEWLRSLGFSQWKLVRESGLMFAVMSVDIDYRRPARLDDELIVTCDPRIEGAASVSFDQHIYRKPNGAAEEDLLITARTRVVCVDASTFKLRRLPGFLRSVLSLGESA